MRGKPLVAIYSIYEHRDNSCSSDKIVGGPPALQLSLTLFWILSVNVLRGTLNTLDASDAVILLERTSSRA